MTVECEVNSRKDGRGYVVTFASPRDEEWGGLTYKHLYMSGDEFEALSELIKGND